MEDEKLSGRVIIDTILINLRQQVEELRYSKVVPAAYDVYLHGDDQQRFDSLTHEIAAEAVRALQETLDTLNRPSRLDRVRDAFRRPRLPYKKVGPWLVRITRDPEGTVPRGRALVVSQIALAGAESFEGQRTRRLSTLSEPDRGEPDRGPSRQPAPEHRAGSRPRSPDSMPPGTLTTSRGEAAATQLADPHVASARPLAVLTWEDEAGSHRFHMTGPELTVGRDVRGSTADIRLAAPPDVSRVHCRIRFHTDDGRFTIEDLSLLGTSVNDQAIGRDAPYDLASPADIRLADAITVRFESVALP